MLFLIRNSWAFCVDSFPAKHANSGSFDFVSSFAVSSSWVICCGVRRTMINPVEVFWISFSVISYSFAVAEPTRSMGLFLLQFG